MLPSDIFSADLGIMLLAIDLIQNDSQLFSSYWQVFEWWILYLLQSGPHLVVLWRRFCSLLFSLFKQHA